MFVDDKRGGTAPTPTGDAEDLFGLLDDEEVQAYGSNPRNRRPRTRDTSARRPRFGETLPTPRGPANPRALLGVGPDVAQPLAPRGPRDPPDAAAGAAGSAARGRPRRPPPLAER